MANDSQQLSELKKELQKELRFGRAACKGDPDAIRDHEDRLKSLREQISRLGG